jgi:hypothetical protein
MGAVSAVAAYPDRNVFVCWPSYDEGWAGEMAMVIKSGRRLVVIGESRGGCTANNRFFDILDSKFEEVGSIYIPQWDGLHDYLWTYVRK